MQKIINFLENCPKKNNLGENITVVGATKTVDTSTIAFACENGLLHIGENKAQEFIEKYPNYPKNATYHFIGHLQTNKVKYIVGKAHLIQSVDSEKLLCAVNECAKKLGVTQNILLEVNVAKDENKHGFFAEQVKEIVEKSKDLSSVRVKGLMSVLPANQNNDKTACYCLQMRELYDIIKEDNVNFEYLSVGMSGDYEIAIKNGSNMIRIGSLLFGNRNYNNNR